VKVAVGHQDAYRLGDVEVHAQDEIHIRAAVRDFNARTPQVDVLPGRSSAMFPSGFASSDSRKRL
jgi:hypothetical protein